MTVPWFHFVYESEIGSRAICMKSSQEDCISSCYVFACLVLKVLGLMVSFHIMILISIFCFEQSCVFGA